jgi:hypothetical protein
VNLGERKTRLRCELLEARRDRRFVADQIRDPDTEDVSDAA